ncbi:MAG: Hsp20/alpha crystallin family protein [Gammaproteobacteria bacterium]|nr:Hsp20/alpha crystallin family protein [Gammaproteobacteria bacterium]
MTSRDAYNWMWHEALDLMDQAERLHRQFFGPSVTRTAIPSWEPPMDVIEAEDALVVSVALPGAAPENVVVTLEAGVLTVSALRTFPACSRSVRIHRLEIPYGHFERRIALPLRALELTGKTLANGCLTLTFTKRKETR